MKSRKNENKKALFHAYFPLIISLIVIVISLVLDLKTPEKHWLKRSGTIVIVLGAYVAYYQARNTMQYNDKLHTMIVHMEPTLNIVATILIILGTIIGGYADLII